MRWAAHQQKTFLALGVQTQRADCIGRAWRPSKAAGRCVHGRAMPLECILCNGNIGIFGLRSPRPAESLGSFSGGDDCGGVESGDGRDPPTHGWVLGLLDAERIEGIRWAALRRSVRGRPRMDSRCFAQTQPPTWCRVSALFCGDGYRVRERQHRPRAQEATEGMSDSPMGAEQCGPPKGAGQINAGRPRTRGEAMSARPDHSFGCQFRVEG